MDNPQTFDIFYFEQHYEEGACRIETDDMKVSMFEWDDSYEIQREPKSKFEKVCKQEFYYPDTLTLMKEGNFLKHGGVPIGVWRTYDKFGDLLEEHDEDEGVKTKWSDMEEILKKNDITLDSVVGIKKELYGEKMFLWKISLKLSGMSQLMMTFGADTGELFFTDFINPPSR